jgi:hypothetical protein
MIFIGCKDKKSRLVENKDTTFSLCEMPSVCIQGGALNRGLFFADPPLSLLGAVSGKISEIC